MASVTVDFGDGQTERLTFEDGQVTEGVDGSAERLVRGLIGDDYHVRVPGGPGAPVSWAWPFTVAQALRDLGMLADSEGCDLSVPDGAVL